MEIELASELAAGLAVVVPVDLAVDLAVRLAVGYSKRISVIPISITTGDTYKKNHSNLQSSGQVLDQGAQNAIGRINGLQSFFKRLQSFYRSTQRGAKRGITLYRTTLVAKGTTL